MADPTTNRLRVKIGGIDYTLRGRASEAELRQVADTVSGMMAQIQKANPQLDQRRAAVLCAVNLADELHRLNIKYQELMQLLDEQTRSTPSGR
jgi:cell division protein ZapA